MVHVYIIISYIDVYVIYMCIYNIYVIVYNHIYTNYIKHSITHVVYIYIYIYIYSLCKHLISMQTPHMLHGILIYKSIQ